jgi:hypothetical protein
VLLRFVESRPRPGEQDEASGDEHVAEKVQRIQVGIAAPAQNGSPEMPGVVREQIEPGVAPLEPSGEKIDGQRESIHLDEERDEECTERAERPPVSRRAWACKAVGEDREDRNADDDERP